LAQKMPVSEGKAWVLCVCV